MLFMRFHIYLITCIVIPISLQSKLASTTNSRMASMIFLRVEPCKILASNILKKLWSGEKVVIGRVVT